MRLQPDVNLEHMQRQRNQYSLDIAGPGPGPAFYTIGVAYIPLGKVPSSRATSQIPTDSRIVNTIYSYAINSSTTPQCPSGTSGWFRVVTKIVTDQAGWDIHIDGQQLTDSVRFLRNDLQVPSPATAFAVTQGGGYFYDTYKICSPYCPRGSTGETDAIQQIFDILPPPYIGTQYDLNYVTLSYKCSGITANGN